MSTRNKIIARPTNTLSQFGFSESALGRPLVGPRMGNDYRRQNGLPLRGGLQGLRDMSTPPPTDTTNPGDGSLERYIETYLGKSGALDPNHPQHSAMMEKAKAEYFLLPNQERVKFASSPAKSTATTPTAVNSSPQATPPIPTSTPPPLPAGMSARAMRSAQSGPQPVAIPYSRSGMPHTSSPTAPQNQTPVILPPPTAALNAEALSMKQRGLVSQSPTTRTFESGATITSLPTVKPAQGSPQPAILQSPYGVGGVTFVPKGTAPGDANLRNVTAAIKERQAGGIYTPENPILPAPSTIPSVAKTPTPTAAPMVTGQMPVVTTPPPSSAGSAGRDNLAGAVLSPRAQRVAAAGSAPVATPYSLPAMNSPVNKGQVEPYGVSRAEQVLGKPIVDNLNGPTNVLPSEAARGRTAVTSTPNKILPSPSMIATASASNVANHFSGSPVGQAVSDLGREASLGLKVAGSLVKSFAQPLVAGVGAVGDAVKSSPGFQGSILDRKMKDSANAAAMPASEAPSSSTPAPSPTPSTTAATKGRKKGDEEES